MTYYLDNLEQRKAYQREYYHTKLATNTEHKKRRLLYVADYKRKQRAITKENQIIRQIYECII